MPHKKLKVAAQGMLDAYKNLLDARGYIADAAQMTAANALQALYTNLLCFKVDLAALSNACWRRPSRPRACISGAEWGVARAS
jgi:cell division protein ZapE